MKAKDLIIELQKLYPETIVVVHNKYGDEETVDGTKSHMGFWNEDLKWDSTTQAILIY